MGTVPLVQFHKDFVDDLKIVVGGFRLHQHGDEYFFTVQVHGDVQGTGDDRHFKNRGSHVPVQESKRDPFGQCPGLVILQVRFLQLAYFVF